MPPLGGKKKRSQAGRPNLTVPTDSTSGVLVSIGTQRLILLAPDNRVIRFVLSPAATYFRMDGQERKTAAAADFIPGDQMVVDSAKDDEGEIYAIQITRKQAGTDEDRKRIAALDQSMVQARLEPVPGGEPEPDDRPRLRRNDGKAATESRTKTEMPKTAEPVQPQVAEQERPQPPATVLVAQDRDKGDDEYGRAPVLKHGKPVQTASTRTPQASPASTPIAAAVSSPEWKADPPMTATQEEHPMLAKAREATRSLAESMPNYITQQVTTRYTSTKRRNPDWHAEDIISAEVIVENGHERYRNLQVNFKPTKKSLDELGGARSTGEFFTVLMDLFDPSTAAEYRYSRPESIANRLAYVFNFKVTEPHSHWMVHSQAQSYKPAYKGSFWVDKETGHVLRIEMQATGIPPQFPYDVVETTTDYDFVRIGAREYLVPIKAENLSCEAATGFCARNLMEFKNYRKFAAESEILPSSPQ